MEARKGVKHQMENGGLPREPGQHDRKPAGEDTARPIPPKKEEGGSSDGDKDDEMEEISIAGRTKMKIPKQKGKQGDEHGDPEAELNSILKQAPGMVPLQPHARRLTDARSRHLL